VSGLHPAFDPVVAKALAKKPDARYATASDFRQALQAAAEQAGLALSADSVTAAVRELVGDVLEARRKMLDEMLGPEAPSRRARMASQSGAEPKSAVPESPAPKGSEVEVARVGQPDSGSNAATTNATSQEGEVVLGASVPLPDRDVPSASSEERVDTGSTTSALVGDLLGEEAPIASQPRRSSTVAIGGAVAALAVAVVAWMASSSAPVTPASPASSFHGAGPTSALVVSTAVASAISQGADVMTAAASATAPSSASASLSASASSSASAEPSAKPTPKLGPATPAGNGKGTPPKGASRLGY
jgi:hypothetical protein